MEDGEIAVPLQHHAHLDVILAQSTAMHRADGGKDQVSLPVIDWMDFSQGGYGVPNLLLADVVLKSTGQYR